MYTKEIIEKVKGSVNIVDVIGSYQSLQRRGKVWLGICPFHEDSTPSLTVNPVLQIYKCFACGASGDVISYVEHAECCSFAEALQLVARRGGVELPADMDETEEDRRARLARETLKEQNRLQQERYISGRQEAAYTSYLASRSLTSEAAEAFGLGYAVSGEFAGRVTYPLYGVSGGIAGFTGRDPGWTKESRGSKYKNSSESELFHKDELLFGLHQARVSIQQQDRAWIVEGQNDVMRMWMCGVKNTVAGSGTAFSAKQARLLQRFTRHAVLMYDGDSAGRKATLRTLKVLLESGFSVDVCRVPEGQDPDSWLLAVSRQGKSAAETLGMATYRWHHYLVNIWPYDEEDAEQTELRARQVAELVSAVGNRMVRRQLVYNTATAYHTDASEIQRMVNAMRRDKGTGESCWEQGLYGTEEAHASLKVSGVSRVHLTFDKERYVEHLDDTSPWVLWQGEAAASQVQQLRQFETIETDSMEADFQKPSEAGGIPEEGPQLRVLLALCRDGQHLTIVSEGGAQSTFTDAYIDTYARYIETQENSCLRTEMVRRCMEVIANTDATEREVNAGEYRRKLQLPAASYKTLLYGLLAERKDRREAERKRLQQSEKANSINFYDVPDYVESDEVLKKQYYQYGFFPLYMESADQERRAVAYVFKNEKGEGHSVVSDFYMEALLFVDPATDHSKRVIRLNHLHGTSQYVEWPSDVFVSLPDIKKRLFASGAYNFNGSPAQWDRIRQVLSYNFTDCYEARVYGWQPEGFLMLPNAVYYPVESGNRGTEESGNRGTGEWRLEYMDKFGVAEVNGMRFYSPASSSIRLTGRQEDNPYEQDELAFYLEGQGANRIDFSQWASLMSEVFSMNENGKWAVMFAIACNFRDFIYSVVGNFTALCFAGPTGSGKTELAYAIRGLWMRRKASVFNLNSGTDAAFFMVLEHFRNMPVIMEEYNDNGISAQKFQGLKAAVYDDQGRVKVKDMASKSMDSSKTNAAPILLGQDTPQQDDGSLSNRVIICDVPRKEGGFSMEETERFDRLKRQSESGLGNVLCEIVRQRGVFERWYKTIYFEEVQRLKRDTWQSTTNKEGLERVIHSVAIMSATARLIEERGSIRLPWTYAEFYSLATRKVVSQMESISTTSKLGMFFASLNTLLGTGRVLYGRELKVVKTKEPSLQVKDGTGTKRVETGIEEKVLYLHFDSCYSAYIKEVQKDTLTKQTLANYFRSNTAYIGVVKSTRFQWVEADFAGGEEKEDGTRYANKQMVQKGFVSSAYVFKYDTLRELFDLDYERGTEEPEEAPQEGFLL